MSTNLSASRPDSGTLTYEPFYGLNEKPFSLSADPRFLFRSPLHAPAFDQLLAGIKRREGLIVLTGEIGTGKTTLCRSVLGHLDRRTFCTFVPDPFVSREDLLRMLLVDCGVVSVDDLQSGRLRDASRPELSYPLYEFLRSLPPLQAFAVLIIDEAQHLPLPLLEEIRILSDLEEREKLLQVVLVGQPELRANLKLPQMRQVDQRVAVRCELRPLSRADVDGYIRCRLNVAAGGVCDRVRFTPDALDFVYQASAGTPRLINRICDRALQEGYSQNSRTIDRAIAARAAERAGVDLPEGEPAVAIVASASPPARRRRLAVAAAAAGIAACAATVGASAWFQHDGKTAAFTTPSRPSPPARPLLRMADGLAIPNPGTQTPEPRSPGTSEPRNFVIQVASFEDDGRAALLATELERRGFRAYLVPFQLDGEPWWQVIAGPFAVLADAETNLAAIRAIPGYGDAAVKRIGSQ